MDDRPRLAELRARRPPPVLHAKHIQRQRFRERRHDPVLADHAVLLPAAHQLSGQQQQRPLAVIHQHQLIHRRPVIVLRHWPRSVAVPVHRLRPLLAYRHLTARQPVLQRQKRARVIACSRHHRKHRQVLVTHRLQQPPLSLRLSLAESLPSSATTQIPAPPSPTPKSPATRVQTHPSIRDSSHPPGRAPSARLSLRTRGPSFLAGQVQWDSKKTWQVKIS